MEQMAKAPAGLAQPGKSTTAVRTSSPESVSSDSLPTQGTRDKTQHLCLLEVTHPACTLLLGCQTTAHAGDKVLS